MESSFERTIILRTESKNEIIVIKEIGIVKSILE